MEELSKEEMIKVKEKIIKEYLLKRDNEVKKETKKMMEQINSIDHSIIPEEYKIDRSKNKR